MCVYIIAFLYLLLDRSFYQVLSAIIIIDKGVMPVEKGAIGLQFYVDVENIDGRTSCSIHSWPKMCCLEDEIFKDCCTDTIYGDNIESVIPKRRETLIYVYPTLYQYDQVGYCDFVIDFRCGRQKLSVQLDVNIPFDTTLTDGKPLGYLKTFNKLKKSACNSVDEDALCHCAPVICDLKYSGRRPFFDTRRNKCSVSPECNTDFAKDFPDIVYDPFSNTCRDLDQTISMNDVYSISTGLDVTNQSNDYNGNEYKVDVTTNCSTISQNLMMLKDLLTGKLYYLFKGDRAAYDACYFQAVISICFYIMAMSALLISIICCINSTFWLVRKLSKTRLQGMYYSYKMKMFRATDISEQPSILHRDLTNNLLKEVLVRDLPLELRESVVEICDRINNDVGRKKRYRMGDLGSQVNLETESETASSSGRSYHGDE